MKAYLFPIALGLILVSCSEVNLSNTTQQPDSPNPSSTPAKQSVTLNRGDLGDIDKLLLQVNRADEKNKKLSAGLFENGEKVLERDKKEGLHGGRSGLWELWF